MRAAADSLAPALRLGLVITALSAIWGWSGCGDDGPRPPDDGAEPRILEVLDPPGDSIGLSFSETTQLRVRYLTSEDDPIASAPVQFTILAGGSEVVGGAALSANQATTDADGVATIELVGGAQGAGFRVSASAERAQPAVFFVTVSDQGFTRLLVDAVHGGPRPAGLFTEVEVRLYRETELTCDAADPDQLPDSVLPVRTLAGFGDTASFPNLASGAAFTVLATATIAPGATPVAFGCMQLDGSQTRNFDVNAALLVRDRSVSMDSALELESAIDLSALQAADAEMPWQVLACPLGAGQLALSCTADALVADGLLDCDFASSTDPLAEAIRDQRGEPDESGCYPASLSGGGDSLDKTIDDAIATGGSFPTGGALSDVVAVRAELASRLVLRSRLKVRQVSAEHRLETAEVGNGIPFAVDLIDSARPVIARTAIPSSVGPAGSPAPLAAIGAHTFTLDTGAILAAGFQALALDALSLAPGGLGSALMASASAGPDSGCDAVSALMCSAIAQPDDCAVLACSDAAEFLDARLQLWWSRLDVGGLDLELSGEIDLRDTDSDLVVDVLGRDATGAVTGSWDVTLETTGGPEPTSASAASPAL